MARIRISAVLVSASSRDTPLATFRGKYLVLCDFEGIDTQCEWSSCVHGVTDVIGCILIP